LLADNLHFSGSSDKAGPTASINTSATEYPVTRFIPGLLV